MADLYILLVIVILASGNMTKLMELVLFIFLMVGNMLENFLRIRFRAREFMNGKTEGSFKAFGRVVK